MCGVWDGTHYVALTDAEQPICPSVAPERTAARASEVPTTPVSLPRPSAHPCQACSGGACRRVGDVWTHGAGSFGLSRRRGAGLVAETRDEGGMPAFAET